jgi:hypothetical protein
LSDAESASVRNHQRYKFPTASTDALVLGDHGIGIVAVSAERGQMGSRLTAAGDVDADRLVGDAPAGGQLRDDLYRTRR